MKGGGGGMKGGVLARDSGLDGNPSHTPAAPAIGDHIVKGVTPRPRVSPLQRLVP